MNLRLDRIFNFNFQGFGGVEKAQTTQTKQAEPVQQAVAKSLIPQTIGTQIRDVGVSFLRQQLQTAATKASLKPVAKAAASLSTPLSRMVGNVTSSAPAAPKTSSVLETFNPNTALGFFSQLASGFVGSLASSLVGKLVSKVPGNLIETGMKVASAIFGGESGSGIDAETRSYLEAFGVDPQATQAAKLYFNSPNGIKGYATTIGNDIHFGDRPDPRYWVAAADLKQLIDSGAPADQIAQGQDRLRNSIHDFSLLAHEVTHVSQQQKEGTVGFAAKYAADVAGGFVSNLLGQVFSGNLDTSKIFSLDKDAPLGKAYRDVRFEKEAYEFELEKIEPKLESDYATLLNYQG
jgi:hypothetical protein